MRLKAGDFLVCLDSENSYMKKDTIYTIELNKFPYLSFMEDSSFIVDYNHRDFKKNYKKLVKRKDNPIIRKLCKIYKEENGYVWI